MASFIRDTPPRDQDWLAPPPPPPEPPPGEVDDTEPVPCHPRHTTMWSEWWALVILGVMLAPAVWGAGLIFGIGWGMFLRGIWLVSP